jgi:hypothetical protein
VAPITGLSFVVHDRHDLYAVIVRRVKYGIWKHAHTTTTHSVFNYAPAPWIGDNLGDGSTHLSRKAAAKIATALLMVANGFLELQGRCRMKNMRHFASKRSMRL